MLKLVALASCLFVVALAAPAPSYGGGYAYGHGGGGGYSSGYGYGGGYGYGYGGGYGYAGGYGNAHLDTHADYGYVPVTYTAVRAVPVVSHHTDLHIVQPVSSHSHYGGKYYDDYYY